MDHPPHGAALDEPALQLPFDVPRTPSTGSRLESHVFELAVPPLARGDDPQGEVIAGALYAAAFGIQLHRYNGQATIPITASRRTGAGETIWTSPWQLHIDATATCGDLVAQAEDLLRRSEAGAGADGSSSPGERSSDSRAAISWIDAGAAPAAFDEGVARARLGAGAMDLQLVISSEGARRRAAFVYNANLFRGATIERFAGHLGSVAASIAADASSSPASLALLTRGEHEWLDGVSRGRRRDVVPGPIHRRIEAHARITPDAVAVRFRDETLTYRRLNARANELARHLVSRGAGRGSRIVVCVEPSFDIAVVLLAILKSGAVYVPIDPSYPAARIGAILDDTKPALIVSRTYLVDRLALGGAAPVVALDAIEESLAALAPQGDRNIDAAIDPADPAYVYYTSGTTGKPKGVMASHANLRSYIQVAQDRYDFGSHDVMPAIARFSFSISMFELMSPLVAGGTLVVLDREHILDPAKMSRTLSEVTFFHAGPSLLKTVLPYIDRAYPDLSPFSRVRHASSGGDMIPPEILESLKRIFSSAEVFVIYGCSEISCMGCTYPVPRDRTIAKTFVGRPFDNTTVRLFDATRRQVPVGVVGEIHFAGLGVVPGYLNRPELTAEKFVEIDGERYYRTGDLGRMSEDGWVEILGRNDFQIKLRGMRIELAEVEHHLRRAPGVKDGAAMAKDAANGEKILVAYVVLDRERSGDGGAAGAGTDRAALSAIRRHMIDSLPDYMIPSAYVELEKLPLNHNMKLDRHALPDPPRAPASDAAKDGGDALVRPPETPGEQRLAAHWRRILGLEQVGLDDNFFELGGHSILAMKLILDVQRESRVALDGMDVLRESLEVLAAIHDRDAGAAPDEARASRTSAATPARADAVETFYFGRDDALYGVLHGAPGAGASHAVLVCTPVGQERVRAHFVLNRLARKLATRGVPVLQFDYFGCWDSLGDSVDATCARWQDDIADAYAELRRRTSASRITAVGARLGATLLCHAEDTIDAARVVVWDPVESGADYYDEMVAMHHRYVRGMRHLRLAKRSPPRGTTEDLLGTLYSEVALRELRRLALVPAATRGRTPVRWLATPARPRQTAAFDAIARARAGSRIDAVDFDSCWLDVARLDDIMPDVGIAHALAAMVLEDR